MNKPTTLEERTKISIECVVRATMDFIEGKITREERERVYDEHLAFITSEREAERKKHIEKERNASMMIEVVLGYLEIGKVKKAIEHLEVTQEILR